MNPLERFYQWRDARQKTPQPRYVGPWQREAPNGEGVINVHTNRLVLSEIMPLSEWREIEDNARR